ncbi:MAG: AmmeMemoRadiSam system protein B [Anaerolineae bacterium]|nr:MAG: AmmeMemoRadiSam system protein B [Anaerolineae bacterium]
MNDLRPSPIAGRWYPGEVTRLRQSVDEYIRAARLPALDGEVVGVIAPHAGHVYSGPVAGHAFAAVQGMTPEVVAVISPMHYPYPYPLLTSGHQAYVTPLGEVEIDRSLVEALDERLKEALGFGLTPVWHDEEHSLEIELPFLQRALDSAFRLLPVMMREQSAAVARALGEALADVLAERNALLVASSDLSHYYTDAQARALDAEMLRRVAAFDPDGVIRAEEEGKAFACGRGAVAAVLWAARALGANRVQVLNYATSGDTSGDYSRVVGYGAAAVLRS